MEVRETYYELWKDNSLYHEGTYEQCLRFAEEMKEPALAEIYKVTLTEERVYNGV